MNAKTTKIIAENESHFVAHLDNGGVRLGMFDICMFDFPAGHAEYAGVVAAAADLATAEDLFDSFYARYVPVPTDGYRNA